MNVRPADNRPSPARPLTRARVTSREDSPTVTFVPASWPYEAFATYLRALMDSHGIADYAELSRLSGVSQTQLSNWRRGLAQPSREALKKVAVPLKTPPHRLFVRAGLDTEEELGAEALPEFEPLPRVIRELHEVYDRMKALGRAADAERSISALVTILRAELEDIDKRRRDQPSGRGRTS